MDSYSLYRWSHTVVFLPFTESKGMQNVSRGIRLPEPQNKFHALGQGIFLWCFCNFNSSPHLLLLSERMREVCRWFPGRRWNTTTRSCFGLEKTLCVRTMVSLHSSHSSFQCLAIGVITHTATSLNWLLLSILFFFTIRPLSYLAS